MRRSTPPSDEAPLPAPSPEPDDIAGTPDASASAATPRLVGRIREPVLRALSLSWVPLTAALLSLILSIASIVISMRQPEVILILPDQVRVAQGRASGSAFVYLQPAFVSTGQNDRVEVIRTMTLEVQAGTGGAVSFTWDEQARLVGDPDTGILSYEYAADPVPLLVSPRNASAPLCLFDAPDGWFFAPGTYTFTLIADRVVTSAPIRASFTIDVSAEDIQFLDGPGAAKFLSFPIR